jgi:hypothetical protein
MYTSDYRQRRDPLIFQRSMLETDVRSVLPVTTDGGTRRVVRGCVKLIGFACVGIVGLFCFTLVVGLLYQLLGN